MRYLISTSTITSNNKNRWLKATIKIDDFRRIPYFCVFSWSEKKFLKRHVQICDTLTISSYNLGTSFRGLGPNVLFREARLVNIHSHVCGNLWGHLFGSNSKLFLYVRTVKITSPLENANTTVSSVHFSRSVVSDSLRSHELQHTRPPCPSSTPGVHSDSCPSSWWCHPSISSSVVPFSSCPQFLPASESFPMSQLFTWGGQSTGVSSLASFLPKNTQDWSPLEWTGWISFQTKGL